jgi:hypothetical protein
MHLLADSDVLPLVTSLGADVTAGVRDDLLQDPACGPLLRAYLGLTHGSVGTDLTPSDRLWNRYYFFLRLVRAHQIRFGPDAGLDQQADQILEYANVPELDWSDLERVRTAAAAHAPKSG